MATSRTGSCLCGSVTYKLTGEPSAKVVCYCNGCRKNSGHIGQIMGKFNSESVEILDPEHHLGKFEVRNTFSGVPKEKQFCLRCGCTIRTVLGSDPGYSYVRTTLVDGSFEGLEPTVALNDEIRREFTNGAECEFM